MMRLKNRVAVVTGAGRGIGKAVAIRLASEGAKVLVADINSDAGNATVQTINANGGHAFFQHTDVANEKSIEDCMTSAVANFGTIHILVNNAAVNIFGHLKESGSGSGTIMDRTVTREMWDKVLKTNLISVAECTKHAVAIMTKNPPSKLSYNVEVSCSEPNVDAGYRGSIVNIASIQGLIGLPEFVPYAAAKAGVLQITRSCATDFAEIKIRVNSVSPGAINTTMFKGHMESLGMTAEKGAEAFSQDILLKRVGAPQEIAGVVAFLASDDASFMTGANVVVDGGQVNI